jgi:phosphoribosylformylglycinamidine cyclo-ligase
MTRDGANRYAAAGVDYTTLDAAKRLAQNAARATSHVATSRNAEILDASRGEPAIVFRAGGLHLGFVLECLGTKSLLARDYEILSGIDRFDAIGYDTVAAIVNDCCCVGALPLVVNAYFATGSASFYAGTRSDSLVRGFARGCVFAGAAWGGGESPTLSGLVAPDAIDLAGAAIGIIPSGHEPILGDELVPGDEIVLVASSGLHANGASLVRAIVRDLPDGLMTALPSGRVLAEAVLDESLIYVPLIEKLLEQNVPLHYASHITGHGLRKLMRARATLTYHVAALLPVPEVLGFLAKAANMTPKESYGTLNMGCGYALIVGRGMADAVVELAASLGFYAMVSGVVEPGPRRVVLEELGIAYERDELDVR